MKFLVTYEQIVEVEADSADAAADMVRRGNQIDALGEPNVVSVTDVEADLNTLLDAKDGHS